MNWSVTDSMEIARGALQAHAKTQQNAPFGKQELDSLLIENYNILKSRMINGGFWRDWCERNGYATSHEAIDFYA